MGSHKQLSSDGRGLVTRTEHSVFDELSLGRTGQVMTHSG
jgi:hypothetical protein